MIFAIYYAHGELYCGVRSSLAAAAIIHGAEVTGPKTRVLLLAYPGVNVSYGSRMAPRGKSPAVARSSGIRAASHAAIADSESGSIV